MIYLDYQPLGATSRDITHNAVITLYQAHHGYCSDDKGNLLFSGNDFQQKMCMIYVWDMIYTFWFKKKAACKVTVFCRSPAFGGVQ